MKFYLLFCFYLTMAFSAFAQAPAIEGDVMLCPYTNGTAIITTSQTYDTYQWYYKYWFLPDEYAAIEGANSASFTYDWLTYDQALLKVVVTTGGQTYESNAIQVDSYNWISLDVMSQYNSAVTINQNDGSFLLCDGGVITNSIGSPFTIIQWYKNDAPIAGATSPTLTVTEPGTYYATAAPGFCPNSSSTSLPITVTANPDCSTPAVVAPVIDGDVLLCPDTNGMATVTNNQTYDTYQWQVKLYGEDTFTDIAGETAASFTYGVYDYAVTTIRLVATANGETYTSNELFIDGYAWASLDVMHEFDPTEVTTDMENGNFLLCDGAAITNTVSMPYTIVQWYKDGEAIEGATSTTYVLTGPGEYYVVAAPEYCPASTSTSLPFIAQNNPDCTAGTNNPHANQFTLYPNPANSSININLANATQANAYTIYDVTGKTLSQGSLTGTVPTVNIEGLVAGSYLIKIWGDNAGTTKMFIKQ